MMRIAAFVSICAFSPIKEQPAYIIRSSSMITSPGLEALLSFQSLPITPSLAEITNSMGKTTSPPIMAIAHFEVIAKSGFEITMQHFILRRGNRRDQYNFRSSGFLERLAFNVREIFEIFIRIRKFRL